MKVSYNLNENNELIIYYGNRILATIVDGKENDDFVEDILYCMDYLWLQDGSLIRLHS